MTDEAAREYPPVDPIKSVLRNIVDSMQIWCEGENMYHLVNGLSQKLTFGSIMPHILCSEKARQRIVDRVIYALEEVESGHISLPDRYILCVVV